MKKTLVMLIAAVFVMGGVVSIADAYYDDCPYYEWPQTRCKFVPKAPETIILRGIQFDTASSKIKPESYFVLEQTLQTVKDYPRRPIVIIGHTDNQGGTVYNQKLSEARANAVRNFFVENGVASWRVTAVGVGEANPIATNRTYKGRAMNRRIEVDFKHR